ncbi:helix-turn-helix domain-containing protein [Longispora albida]|uniref:helix-turn-helix domain-containing protein n=1 Tax=Longispora albida TaxID=203523 RepID=UPI00035D73F0|nr:helix-turn-helix transcriptional regulator [Longispora albida]
MESSLEETLAELREARLSHGLSQADVAERMGTTQSAVARLEAAQSDPRLSTLLRYAESVGERVGLLPQREASSVAATAAHVKASLAAGDADEALRHIIQMLDDLHGLTNELRLRALRDEPDSVGDRRWDALLAGVAEYASGLFGLAVPGWTAAPGRFLHRFWFVVEDVLGRPAPGLAALAFVSAPPALANRGVFLDGDSLVSV